MGGQMAEGSNDQVSGAAAVLQESGAVSASTAASEGKQQVQEQTPDGATAQTGDLNALVEQAKKEAAEQARREAQSAYDKRIHQMQMQMEAVQAQQAEAARKAEEQRLAELDDEDFGREMRKLREQQANQARAQQEALAAEQRRNYAEWERTVAKIPAERREDFQKQASEKTHSIEEFRDFYADYMADIKAEQLAKKMTEVSAKAQQHDAIAQAAAVAAPVVTTGQYQHSSKPLSTDELLTQGIDEAFAKLRKSRG